MEYANLKREKNLKINMFVIWKEKKIYFVTIENVFMQLLTVFVVLIVFSNGKLVLVLCDVVAPQSVQMKER